MLVSEREVFLRRLVSLHPIRSPSLDIGVGGLGLEAEGLIWSGLLFPGIEDVNPNPSPLRDSFPSGVSHPCPVLVPSFSVHRLPSLLVLRHRSGHRARPGHDRGRESGLAEVSQKRKSK